MAILITALCGFALDLFLGDPPKLSRIHPVVLIGHTITFLEQRLRRISPRTPKRELFSGSVLVFLILTITLSSSLLILFFLDRLSPFLSFVIRVIWSWQCLAIRDLKAEAMNVYKKLCRDELDNARIALSRIVGRDTNSLNQNAVIRAVVETVAENFSDGIVAPLFYMLLGGVPLSLCYKAINTMDSMIGYQNERYLHFGRCAAKLDDIVNYLPSRIAALVLILASFLCKEDCVAAFRIWKRDRRKHESPNSAQCESVAAGALGLRLCGPASYFGTVHDKPWIGDDRREPNPTDIPRTCRLEYTGSFLALVILGMIRLGVLFL